MKVIETNNKKENHRREGNFCYLGQEGWKNVIWFFNHKKNLLKQLNILVARYFSKQFCRLVEKCYNLWNLNQ